MPQARVANSVDCTFHPHLFPAEVIDDLGLQRLAPQQSADRYQLIISRHRVYSYVITSNRTVEYWLSLFDYPFFGNSALYLLAYASYRIVIEGTSYRERLSLHQRLVGLKKVIDPSFKT